METIDNQNNNASVEQEKQARNQSDSRDLQPIASIQDLVGGSEKAEEIKSKLEQGEDDEALKTVARTSDVESEAYPKPTEVVTNKKFTYGN